MRAVAYRNGGVADCDVKRDALGSWSFASADVTAAGVGEVVVFAGAASAGVVVQVDGIMF